MRHEPCVIILDDEWDYDFVESSLKDMLGRCHIHHFTDVDGAVNGVLTDFGEVILGRGGKDEDAGEGWDGLIDEDPINGMDDDNDGLIDEDDGPPGQGIDDDGDGAIDEDYVDGEDNDGDGLIDEDGGENPVMQPLDDDVLAGMPDIYTVQAVYSFIDFFYQIFPKYIGQVTTLIKGSGRWNQDEFTTFPEVVSVKDLATLTILKMMNEKLEIVIDDFVEQTQKDINQDKASNL